MPRIFDCFMFRDELDMLFCRMMSMQGWATTHVLVEAAVTHRGVPKPLLFQEHALAYRPWGNKIRRVVADLPDHRNPWVREHAQRNAAWPVVDEMAGDDDIVLICDLDEIPSASLLLWDGPDVAAVYMRTCIYAVDWECTGHLPPTCVVARVGWLREQAARGLGLAEVRDQRSSYATVPDGGWHLSWIGGPERQIAKLETASCHGEEIDRTPEAALIRSGERYRTGADGGGLPVKGVDVDESWPEYVSSQRCPPEWFRPR